jgi:hypothetical protein
MISGKTLNITSKGDTKVNRREFIMTAAATGLAGCMTGGEKTAACDNKGKILFGVCRPLKDAKILKAHGYDFFETSVAGVLMPTCSKTEYTANDDVFVENKYTAPASVTGLPVAIAEGVQLIGAAFTDGALLDLAKVISKEGR